MAKESGLNKNLSNNTKEGSMDIGGNKFTMKPVALTDMSNDRIYSFTYGTAETKSGTKGRGMSIGDDLYDSTPLIVVLNSDSKHLLGLNIHYFDVVSEKTRFIVKMRLGKNFDQRLIKKSIHLYRLDRIRSRIYEVNNLIADQKVLSSAANWVTVKK